jgi:hypothetical protein
MRGGTDKAPAQPLRRSQRCAQKQPGLVRQKDRVEAVATEDWDGLVVADKPCQTLDPACSPKKGGHTSVDVEQAGAEQSGLWNLLPQEVSCSFVTQLGLNPYISPLQLLEDVLDRCTTQQLGMLEASCTFFRKLAFVDQIAKQRLKAIPRARGLKPNKRYVGLAPIIRPNSCSLLVVCREGEGYLALLHFVNTQSAAAAQATGVACGSHHTAALLIPTEGDATQTGVSRDCKHALYAFGRGIHGQLGADNRDDCNSPAVTSLGYRPCQVRPFCTVCSTVFQYL